MVRYEILLPQRDNDGNPIEDEKFTETRLELLNRFQAVSFESSAILGLWIHFGVVYEDQMVRLFVDADETPETEDFLRRYKETLRNRFGQVEIWITAHAIRVI